MTDISRQTIVASMQKRHASKFKIRSIYLHEYNYLQPSQSVHGHRIDNGPEVSLRQYFVRNFTSAEYVKIHHHMTPYWSAHGSFS